MATCILIYDVIRKAKLEYKSHYRLYDTNRNLLAEGDYIYTVRRPRKMPPAVLKSKIVTGIIQRLKTNGLMAGTDSYISECLVSRNVLLEEMADFLKPVAPTKVVKTFEKKVVVEDNPRIYRVEQIGGHYTIVKVDNPYLTREQAKEVLFSKQLESL